METKVRTGKAAKHRHWFHAWPIHFGPYGPRDCHYHVCCASDDPEACQRVLMADTRECDGKIKSHYRTTL